MKIRLRTTVMDFPRLALVLIPSVLVTALVWATSENEISAWQGACALAALYVPLHSYHRWRREKRGDLPLFALLSFIYWVYYAMPLFWGDRIIDEFSMGDRMVTEEAVTQTMFMALAGIASLGLGMWAGIGRRLTPRQVPDISFNQSRWNYLRAILVGGMMMILFDPSPYLFGEEGRQIVLLVVNVVPTLAFAILLRRCLQGEAVNPDKLLVGAYLAMRLMIGISSGWLGSSLSLMIICGGVYLMEKRRIPALIVSVAVVFLLFFQVGKEEFRKTYWNNEVQGEIADSARVERVQFWLDTSVSKWEQALSNPSGQTLRDLTYPSISRISLLTQTANVLEMTPARVPYQYGRLYTYIGAGLVPRFLWPDKPSMNEANQYYQTAYGLTSEDKLATTSFTIGVLTESYINFGWMGVAPVMFLLGVFLDWYRSTFLVSGAGMLMNGVGVILLPQFIAIESQLAVYASGIVQTLVMVLLVLLPIIRFRRFRSADKSGALAS